ncbi:DUF3014 domain-containing protein [Alkalimonas delamerensis]|uniref:DUF3014 domain-containing protein n=1 Tax=Alkalimonas delamerensis TaxID=265981 RepID=A0ABT9GM80_9GAMM|nr:DUF3014 domain-containing protein [Alkalimonas delamerensis]MDP4528042.1 DUF3014 domain-containing protein [Alkalimonas delamerensis]
MSERDPSESSATSASGQQLYYLGLAAVAVAVLLALWLLLRSGSPEPERVVVPPVATPVAQPVPEPIPEPIPEKAAEPDPMPEPVTEQPEAVAETEILAGLPALEPEDVPEPELPGLNESDPVVKDSLLALPWQPGLAGLFVREDMVRRFVVLTDNLSRGQISSDHLVLTTPDTPFAVREQEGQLSLDPAGFSRYEPYLQLLESVPVEAQLALLRQYQPLLDEAFAELGYPDTPFEQRLLEAIDYLLAQPVMDGFFELELPTVMYHFAEPHLEAMNDVQKQLIRIGPDNQRRLNQLLQRLKSKLE